MTALAKLDAPTLQILNRHATAIHECAQRTIRDIIEIGRHLTEAKRLVVGHGHFQQWLKDDIHLTSDTAERFMQVFAMVDQNPQIADYDIPVSALYALAKPSTPDPARKEVLKRAAAGERQSGKEITKVIAKNRKTSLGMMIGKTSKTREEPLTGPASQEPAPDTGGNVVAFPTKPDTSTDAETTGTKPTAAPLERHKIAEIEECAQYLRHQGADRIAYHICSPLAFDDLHKDLQTLIEVTQDILALINRVH